MWKEFKDFAIKGNVIDMAVGIIIGAAFGTIAKSIVDDIIMPPIGVMINNVDFTAMFWVIKQGTTAPPYDTIEAAKSVGAVTVNYGRFINNVVAFIIVSFSVFMLVKIINMLKKKDEEIPQEAPSTKDCPYCLTKVSLKATRCPACTSELDASV